MQAVKWQKCKCKQRLLRPHRKRREVLCECLSTLAALVHERQSITIHINLVKNFLVSLSLSVSLILPSFTLCHMSLRLETKPSIIVILQAVFVEVHRVRHCPGKECFSVRASDLSSYLVELFSYFFLEERQGHVVGEVWL